MSVRGAPGMARLLPGASLAAAGAPAAARRATVDAGGVEGCFGGTAIGETRPACTGADAEPCRERPAGSSTIGTVGCVAAETAAWDAVPSGKRRAARDALAGAGAAGIDAGRAPRDARRARIACRGAGGAPTRARRWGGATRSVVAADCALLTATRAVERRDTRGEG